MSSSVNWETLLDKKYPSYKIEVNAYLDSLDVSNSIGILAQFIYDVIKDDNSVNKDLKLLYKKALFCTNKEVKLRIKNMVSNCEVPLGYRTAVDYT